MRLSSVNSDTLGGVPASGWQKALNPSSCAAGQAYTGVTADGTAVCSTHKHPIDLQFVTSNNSMTLSASMEAQLCTPCPASTVAIGGNCLTDGTGVYLEQAGRAGLGVQFVQVTMCEAAELTGRQDELATKVEALRWFARFGAGFPFCRSLQEDDARRARRRPPQPQ
jgi:hypothetical protein